MPLVDIEISIGDSDLPVGVVEFLDEADRRVDRFLKTHSVQPTGFVPCDPRAVYGALQVIIESNLAVGSKFCEWGSGFGVVASLAVMLGFDVYGIEIDGDLVDASQRLSDDFALSGQFIHGSFVPAGAQHCVEAAYIDQGSEFVWVVTDADDAYDQLGLEPDDFDVVFAYPWPGEDNMIATLFEKCASVGALLLTYGEFDSIHLRRKVSRE